MVEKTIFGTMEDGREVSRYTLTNQNGVSASFLDLGAIWSTMLVPDRNGEMADVLLGHETVADCLVSDGHLGEAVGRNANRIGGAAFTLNDKKYELTANDGPNNLHSGMDFYRNRIWAAEYETGVNRVSFTLEARTVEVCAGITVILVIMAVGGNPVILAVAFQNLLLRRDLSRVFSS